AARAVGLFWPLEGRGEVDLRELDAALRGRGARIAYPALEPPERAMTFRFPEDARAMAAPPEAPIAGLVQPTSEDPAAGPDELEVIVVPCLAVDPSGQRIGYGGGHYDATLPRYAPPALTIAVAFDFQLVPEVPANGDDVPVRWIVTDARTLEAEP
ncbi:MAG: 5-formyltetrahydrofolate cyclo-ligase, partial [Myxococcales bacterium]|nr:5-formyltetrahydrofolate cyclo-ligase [Myxococcales bacterium]